jgi:hypothetical protein
MNAKTSKTEQVNFTVDAIAMKRRIQEQIYKDTKDMTPEEFIAYMHRRIANSQFADFLNKVAPSQPPTRGT